jgi:secondary thiamine-phosphate synthase enzyme
VRGWQGPPDRRNPKGPRKVAIDPGVLHSTSQGVRQAFTTIEIETRSAGLVEITGQVSDWLAGEDIDDGLVTLFIRHTSASLVIQENADPDVQADLDAFLRKLVPEDSRLYRHTAEGDDDMPAHIRAALTATQLSIPLRGGRLRLGTWQGIYLFEHRRGRFRRSVDVHLLGE